MLASSILILTVALSSSLDDEEEDHPEPQQQDEQDREERQRDDAENEQKGVEEWQKQATFDESVLAPRLTAKTSTLAPPETDVGLSLGARELGIEASDRLLTSGLRLGPQVIDTQIYMSLVPEALFAIGDWKIALQLPLNLLLLQPGTNTFGRFALRARDWDEVSDYVRIVRSLEFEVPGMKFSADAYTPRTLLYGHLVSAYQPSLDLNHPSTGLMFRFERDVAVADLLIADVTFERAIFGTAGTFYPFELTGVEAPILRRLAFAFEAAADLRAPACVQPSANDARCIRAVGNRPGVDPDTRELRDDTFVTTSHENGLPFVMNTRVAGFGSVVFTELYRSSEMLIESQASWHTLVRGGHGFALGVSLAGAQHRGLRVEGRLLTDRFIFGYFDTLYEVEKIESFARASSTEIAPTRHQAVFGDDRAGVEPVAKGIAFGYRLAGSWQIFPYTPLTLTAGLENTSRASDTRIYLHLDFQAFERIHIFGTMLRLGADGGQTFARAADQGGLVLLAGGRARIFDSFAVIARYAYLQSLGHAPGGEIHLGDPRIATGLIYTRERIFEPQHTVALEVELTWGLL